MFFDGIDKILFEGKDGQTLLGFLDAHLLLVELRQLLLLDLALSISSVIYLVFSLDSVIYTEV